MLQHFSRTRSLHSFKTRAADRDTQTDDARLASVWQSVADALQAARVERAGLVRRLDDISAQAATSLGNEADEYLTRDTCDIALLHQIEPEIMKGRLRLEQLAHSIAQLELLTAVLKNGFPGAADRKLDR